MPNVGTITGSMYLDPSAYISGLNSAAGATQQFQQGVSTVSFAGFNRGIFATTTLLYGLERIMSNMSKGMEEYANMLGRIGTVADLTAASVSALADSMKQISVYQGVSRKDIMGGMYTAAQAGYQTPAEMRGMAAAGARLSRASGKEIDVKKSVDLQSGIRQALGIGMDSVSSNRMNDVLLKGRDIGRWELDQMAHALGIPLTVWGNQFAGKQDGEETLRQLLAVMSVASLAGVSPNMTATGTRRIVEKTVTLANSGKKGDPLRKALRGVGFTGQDPIMDALNEGGMKYLNTLMGVSNNGETGELTRLGYGSRDLLVLTSALRGKGQKLNEAYEELSYGNAAGTTERYGEKMRKTYDYSRDQLRAQWEITSQEFMTATIPLIGQFTNMLMGLNSAAQALPESVKSFMLLIGATVAMRLALNFAGFRSAQGASGGGIGRMVPNAVSGAAGFARQNSGIAPYGAGTGSVTAARLARRHDVAAGRGFSRYLTPQASPMWNANNPITSSSPTSLAAMSWRNAGASSGVVDEMRMEALRNRYSLGAGNGIPMTSGRYGPSLAARIRWEAYKRGESVDFSTGSYGSLASSTQGYFSGRGKNPGSPSVSVWNKMQDSIHGMNSAAYSRGGGPGAPSQWQGFRGGLGYVAGELRQDARNLPSLTNMGKAAGMLGMQGIGSALSGIGKFASTIGETFGPLIKFSIAISALGTIIDGIATKAAPEQNEGGLSRLKSGTGKYGLLDSVKWNLKFAGAYQFGDGDEARNQFMQEHGLVTDIDGKGWTPFQAWRRTGTDRLAGAREATMNDVMKKVAREQLSPNQVKQFKAGGIDFANFETAKPYLNEHMKGMGKIPPAEGWDSWLGSTKNALPKAVEWMADALKQGSEKIAAAAGQSAQKISSLGYAAPTWSASVSWMTTDAVARQRILSGRQWDIYSGADYSGRGNGGLNWNAGGKDYKAMYASEMDNLDSRFGGFTDQSYSANARGAIDIQRKMWDEKAALVGAKFGGLTEDPGLSMMLREGDEDFAKMKRYKEVLRQMPNIGTMSEAEQMALFTKMSGRDLKSDVYAKADFDNFRNFDMSKIATVEQLKPPVQYASSTQFGTAEAYNQLLTRPDASEKMSIAVDKWIAYADSQSVKKADVEAELQKVIKAAVTFFEQDSVSDIGKNLELLAVEAMT